jgi:alpha-1,2-mannosyltransferase
MGPGATVPGLFSPAVTFNYGLAGAFSRLFPDRVALVRALSLGSAALLLVPALIRARRAATPEEAQRALPPIFVVMVMGSPLVYLHHMIYLLPAALTLVAVALRERRYAVLAGTIVLVALVSVEVPTIYAHMHFSDLGMRVATSLTLYALLALYAVALAATRPRAHQP